MSNNSLGPAAQVMVMAIVITVILLFVGIGILVSIHVCIVGRTFRRGFRNHMEERDSNGSTSMSHNDLEKLPCFDFEEQQKGSSPVDCVVCLENFKLGDKCRLLPICNHSFHAHCVDSWLLKTPICPICRTSADSRKSSLVSSGVGFELQESQPVVVGTQLSSNGSPLQQASALEPVV